MAREEHDREDLLREATALVERVELSVAGFDENVFAGFRRDGGASFYFGQDHAFHFTSDGKLRRAFREGLLYKAEQGRLVALARRRTPNEVALVRRPSNAVETTAMLAEFQRRAAELSESMDRAAFRTIGRVPEHADVVARVRAWLVDHAASISVADSPRSA